MHTTTLVPTTCPYLVSAQGDRMRLTQEAYELAKQVAQVLSSPSEGKGRGPHLVGTGTAAKVLGVSRRTVARMIDRRELPCERIGGNHHRRVAMEDVVSLALRVRAQRSAALEEMRDAADEAGFSDTDLSSYLDGLG